MKAFLLYTDIHTYVFFMFASLFAGYLIGFDFAFRRDLLFLGVFLLLSLLFFSFLFFMELCAYSAL